MVSGISGGLQAVRNIGEAMPDSIHWPTRSMPQERENLFFEQVISIHVGHPKWLSAVGLGDYGSTMEIEWST